MDDETDIDDEDELEEEEFSLDQLSRAYAEVMREKNPDAAPAADAEANLKQPDSNGRSSKKSDNVSPAQRDDAENRADNAACPLTPESIIEAMLFVGTPKGIPLEISQIAAELRDVSPAEVREHVADLNKKYESEDAAFRISIEENQIQMVLTQSLAELQNNFYGRNKQFQLSQPAIDVLSVVAYNQPVTKDQVESARGKSSGSILAQLVRRNLLLQDLDEPKRALRTYVTTDRFLQLFNLTAIEDLPQSHDVSEFEEYIDD